LECHYASKHHLLEYWLFPLGRLNLGFITEGKLAAVLIKPSLGVSNWPVIYFINYMPISSLALFNTAPSKAITSQSGSMGIDPQKQEGKSITLSN
jgi:hypothetical protein